METYQYQRREFVARLATDFITLLNQFCRENEGWRLHSKTEELKPDGTHYHCLFEKMEDEGHIG